MAIAIGDSLNDYYGDPLIYPVQEKPEKMSKGDIKWCRKNNKIRRELSMSETYLRYMQNALQSQTYASQWRTATETQILGQPEATYQRNGNTVNVTYNYEAS